MSDQSDNYRPDVYGQVEAAWWTKPPPQEMIDEALTIECPDCNVNVFVEEDPVQDGVYEIKVAHDATCPWLEAEEEKRRADDSR